MTCGEMYSIFRGEMLGDVDARERAREEFTNNYVSDKIYLCKVDGPTFGVAMIAWDDPTYPHWRKRANWLINGDTKAKLDDVSNLGLEVLLVHFVSNARQSTTYERVPDLSVVFAWKYDQAVLRAMGIREGMPRGEVAWNCKMKTIFSGMLEVDAMKLGPLPWEVVRS
jgi:hypothetical protein